MRQPRKSLFKRASPVLPPTIRKGQEARDIIVHYLTRPEGTTSRELLPELGWKSISINNHAEKAGVTITRVAPDADGAVRYWGCK